MILRKNSLWIAVLGVDGVGKSTVIREVTTSFLNCRLNTVYTKHLRPNILPPLSYFFRRKKQISEIVTDPHAAKPSNQFVSILRILYLLTDYIIGYFLYVRIKLKQNSTIIIFDRYAYDLLIDPRRFRVSLSASFIKILIFFIPKPDIVFCLYGDPNIIASRKNELSIIETERQVNQLVRLANDNANKFKLISTNISLEDTVSQVISEIKKYALND
jgi:thymidylate kinase